MTTAPLRLAMRVEGRNWCAYLAKPDIMKGAIFIGSIALRFIEENKERRDTFMTGAVGDIIEEMFGEMISKWETKPAPDSERSGSA